MASPVHAGTLLPLLPTTDKTPCERIQPGIINWMQEITKGFAWEFTTGGAFSDEWLAMFRALPCVGYVGTIDCPVVTLTGTATPGNAALTLSFNGTRMDEGYAYSIFRSVTEGVFIDPAIITGTTVGSVINYTDNGLVNGTTYYYKLLVQKPTCDAYDVEISGTPVACATLLLDMTAEVDAPGHVKLTVTGNLALTYAFKLFASNLVNQIGSVVLTGTIADSQCQVNGALALCLEHEPTLTGTEGGLKLWTYTVKVQQDPACNEYVMVLPVIVTG